MCTLVAPRSSTNAALDGDASPGVANGITPDNVDQALPWVDVFLVATGIRQTFTELDPARVQALTPTVFEYNQRH